MNDRTQAIVDQLYADLVAERALADYLYEALNSIAITESAYPKAVRAKARYREARRL